MMIRTFDTGATRDQDENKHNFDGFLSVPVMRRYARYMHANRVQSDGTLRAADNWKQGIPIQSYRESMWRHFFDVLDELDAGENPEESLCALKFNVDGMLHEVLKR